MSSCNSYPSIYSFIFVGVEVQAKLPRRPHWRLQLFLGEGSPNPPRNINFPACRSSSQSGWTNLKHLTEESFRRQIWHMPEQPGLTRLLSMCMSSDSSVSPSWITELSYTFCIKECTRVCLGHYVITVKEDSRQYKKYTKQYTFFVSPKIHI